MEKQLVSFGNHLLERYNVMVFSSDGTNTPLYQRKVSDADLSNWREVFPEEVNIKLPSAFQIGDPAWLCLWSQTVIVEVLGVHFYPSKVKYDLKVIGEDGQTTRLYNVDSAFLSKIHPNLREENLEKNLETGK